MECPSDADLAPSSKPGSVLDAPLDEAGQERRRLDTELLQLLQDESSAGPSMADLCMHDSESVEPGSARNNLSLARQAISSASQVNH